jgi:hypothetical protein
VDGGQQVGIVANNDAGNGEIDFIIMEERTNVDPEKWIRKR